MQGPHGMPDQYCRCIQGLHRGPEFGDERRGGNRRETVPVPSAVSGRVIGVNRAETCQPRQLAAPGGAAAHQPVNQDQRSPGTAAVGQRCGVHRLILPVT